jgi:hypothetical protein
VNVDRVESTTASVSADLESGAISQSLGDTRLRVKLNAVSAYIEELDQYADSEFGGAVDSFGERLQDTKGVIQGLLGI